MIHVKVSIDYWCSRTLPMNVAIESAHCGCERNLCKDWVWSKMCRKHGRIWSKAHNCIKMWYSNSRTYFGQSVHSQLLSSLVPQHPSSHCNEFEPSHMEAMVRMANNGNGSTMVRDHIWMMALIVQLVFTLHCKIHTWSPTWQLSSSDEEFWGDDNQQTSCVCFKNQMNGAKERLKSFGVQELLNEDSIPCLWRNENIL